MLKALAALSLIGQLVHPAATTINVATAAQLSAALSAAKAGDTIKLADGDYSGQFVATRPGTASAPITLVGSAKAVLHDPLFNPGDTDCPSGQTGYGLWLQGASYWNLTGFTVTYSKKGIVLDGASHVTIDGVNVHDIGYEGVHFRKSSAYGVIKNSTVTDTGKEEPGYGEGVYLGSATSNWECYGANGGKDPDASDYVQVLDNKIGPNVAAEGVDIKEGTHDGVVSGNTLDGTGEKNQNSGDSTIDVKGDKYLITRKQGDPPVPRRLPDAQRVGPDRLREHLHQEHVHADERAGLRDQLDEPEQLRLAEVAERHRRVQHGHRREGRVEDARHPGQLTRCTARRSAGGTRE